MVGAAVGSLTEGAMTVGSFAIAGSLFPADPTIWEKRADTCASVGRAAGWTASMSESSANSAVGIPR